MEGQDVREAARRDVTRAFDSLGPEAARGTFADVGEAVIRRALAIRRLTRDGSLPMLVMASRPIPCTIVSVAFEERTQRFVVELVARNSEGGEPERMRSGRVDDATWGELTWRMWSRDLVGHDAVVYKLNEPAPEGSRASAGFRVAHWVQDLGPATRRQS